MLPGVLYDLSLLGFCKDDPTRITGMPRVVLEQAVRLQAATECTVTFCATEDPADAFRFIRAHPVLRRARVAACPDDTPVVVDPAALAGARVFHTPHSAVPDAVRRAPHLAVVQTVYDMIPFLLPETMTAEYREYYADIVRRIRPTDRVITISRSAKDDFCDYTGFPEERVHVIPLAANAETFRPCPDPERVADVRSRYGIPAGPYLLSVCTFEPRKNLRHLIRSFVALLRSQPEMADLSLVLTGGQGWMFEPVLAELDATGPLRSRIITTGYLPDADLAPLYSGALAFLYLSRYEGFGLPPLEAMQCGTPVIAANTSSLPEVVGDAGILLSPDDRGRTACVPRCSVCTRTPTGERNWQGGRSDKRGVSVGRRTSSRPWRFIRCKPERRPRPFPFSNALVQTGPEHALLVQESLSNVRTPERVVAADRAGRLSGVAAQRTPIRAAPIGHHFL